MLNVVMLSVIMLSVIMLNVVMLSVIAPTQQSVRRSYFYLVDQKSVGQMSVDQMSVYQMFFDQKTLNLPLRLEQTKIGPD
jgi:hypothetical protein